MLKRNQNGAVGGVWLGLILTVILLIGAILFGVWAFSSRQSYKNDVDAKISVAVTTAKQQQTTVDNAQFAQEAKDPLRTYNGPEAYGSLVVKFPKTWSAYVDDTDSGSALVDGYFSPNVVPSISDQTSVFALRVQVQSQAYNQAIQSFNDAEQNNQLTAQAYSLPKVPKVVGVKVNGMLPDGNTGTMVVLPLRSETIELWTEGTQFVDDFNNRVLPNFSFSP